LRDEASRAATAEGFIVYVASLRSSNKTQELERNEKVELC
jgi:hypothetical protein